MEGGGIIAKRKKVIRAGPLVMESIYPAPAPRDSRAARAGKRQLSSEAQKRMNLKYKYRALEFLLAGNFWRGDVLALLTYDDAHLPRSREEAVKRFRDFLERLRYRRRKRGEALRYVYITESKHGDGRLHHHLVVNATGEDYDDIRDAWGQGEVFCKSFRVDRDKNFESLARYFCKELPEKVGKRNWTPSLHLKKPEIVSEYVPNHEALVPPRGADVLSDTGDVDTVYGNYRYIKYLDEGWNKKPRKRARKRGRRKTA